MNSPIKSQKSTNINLSKELSQPSQVFEVNSEEWYEKELLKNIQNALDAEQINKQQEYYEALIINQKNGLLSKGKCVEIMQQLKQDLLKANHREQILKLKSEALCTDIQKQAMLTAQQKSEDQVSYEAFQEIKRRRDQIHNLIQISKKRQGENLQRINNLNITVQQLKIKIEMRKEYQEREKQNELQNNEKK